MWVNRQLYRFLPWPWKIRYSLESNDSVYIGIYIAQWVAFVMLWRATQNNKQKHLIDIESNRMESLLKYPAVFALKPRAIS